MTRLLGSIRLALAAILWVVLSASGIARAANQDEPDTFGIWRNVRHVREEVCKLRPPEALEMFVAILAGSELGPGEGWFHPSQTRYGWKWLASRYDEDQDGKVTFLEFPGRGTHLRRLDRNKDESLTQDDFDWSDQSQFAKQSAIPGMWFRKADSDSNGKISRAEWEALFHVASQAKGFLTPADLRDAFPLVPPKRPATAVAPSGPSPQMLLAGLLAGEIGCLSEGPRLDEVAPDFTLKTHDGRRTVSLAEFREKKKPVVLIFGSFT